MAGNTKTAKSIAPKTAQTKPGSKGVMVGKNAGKGVVKSTAQTSKMSKMKIGSKC
jgi:hypothetical protein